jgi:hypothetical protein
MNGPVVDLGDVTVWLGLKNSDDQGTNFDLRVEVFKNGAAAELVTAGESHCIASVTRNAAKAREVAVALEPFSPVTFDGTNDVLALTILTRIGMGTGCGGHVNAAGRCLYFDSVSRDSRMRCRWN